MDQDKDHALVQAVLEGDRERFAAFVERYEPLVRKVAWETTHDRAATEDLTQEVFLRVYFALPTYDPRFRLSTWLHQIARNLAINHLRWRARHAAELAAAEDADLALRALPDPAANPAAALERRERDGSLWRAVESLPEDFREVVLLRHRDELSYEEICERTGLPIGTVKSRLARARRMLAQQAPEIR
jgi:RNA polymerase sigma-70 factor (ECF subfamily)